MAREVNHIWVQVFLALNNSDAENWFVCTSCGAIQRGNAQNQDCPGSGKRPDEVIGVPV